MGCHVVNTIECYTAATTPYNSLYVWCGYLWLCNTAQLKMCVARELSYGLTCIQHGKLELEATI